MERRDAAVGTDQVFVARGGGPEVVCEAGMRFVRRTARQVRVHGEEAG